MQKKIPREMSRHIVRCWREGWFVDNIARICRTDADTVVTVLRDKGIQM